MAKEPKADIYLRRLNLTREGAIIGEMNVKGVKFASIENRNCNDIWRPWVRMGYYTLEMDTKNTGETVRCLRFVDDPSIRTFLIHRAHKNNFCTLTGCIAPGMINNASNVLDSETAMERIFELLGGFQDRKRSSIYIQNNVPGSKDTKEAWLKRRKSESV